MLLRPERLDEDARGLASDIRTLRTAFLLGSERARQRVLDVVLDVSADIQDHGIAVMVLCPHVDEVGHA